MKKRKLLVLISLLLLSLATVVVPQWSRAPFAIAQANVPILVSAASSLTNALQELAPLSQSAQPKFNLRYNFASSGVLLQQITSGAPADIFISASPEQMDALQQQNLLLANTRRNLLRNQLVLVVSAQATGNLTLKGLAADQIKRIAIGDPKFVPAGEYTEAALTKSGLWNQLKPKFVLATNVRQVLQFVESGNVDAGFVYLTDAKTTDKVKITQTIPDNLHPPILYPVAVLKNSRQPTAAKTFVQFLTSKSAKQIFSKYGFKLG
jgi:molybdate transport system substrate-binding protein